MRLLDRYILRELVGPLFFSVLAFTGLFLSVDLIPLVRTSIDYGASLGVMATLVALKLPEVFMWTFPMAVLLATLLSLSRLSSGSEIIAMQAGTVSFYRIVAPVIAVGLAVSLLALAMGEWVVPRTNFAYRRIFTEDVQRGQLPTTTRNVILKQYERGMLHAFLYASRFDTKTRTMHDVTLVELQAGRPVRTTFARQVLWQGDSWYMEDGAIHEHDDEPGLFIDFREGRQPIAIGYSPDQVVQAQRKPEEMTIKQLRDHIAVLRARGDSSREHSLQLHLKFSVPLTSFVFALLAAPLGIQSHRSASSAGFGVSMLVILIYYVLMTVGTALGQGGQLPPVVAAWLPNGVLGAVGVALLIKSGRR